MSRFIFENKFYNSKVFRPKTDFFIYESEFSFLNIITQWSGAKNIKNISDQVYQIFSNLYQDPDSTRISQPSDILTSLENHLQDALTQTHHSLEQGGRAQESIELLSLIKIQNHIYIAQTGQPNILLLEDNMIVPLSTITDYCFDYKEANSIPIPKSTLGDSKNLDINFLRIRVKENSKILFLSRSWIPRGVFDKSLEELNMHNLSQSICSDQPEIPFWIGLLSF